MRGTCGNCGEQLGEHVFAVRVRDYRKHLSGKPAPWRLYREAMDKRCAEDLAHVSAVIDPNGDYEVYEVSK